jgi:hypothetical protein
MIGNYHVANDRCIIDLRWCDGFPGGRDAILEIITQRLGFTVYEADPIGIARKLVNTGRYLRGADTKKTPEILDCSSLTQWVYKQMGILIPRPSVDQRDCGIPVNIEDAVAGDLVFTTGPQNYFVRDPESGIGHVGLLTGEGSVIHASPGKPAITEVSIEDFFRGREERGVTRILPPSQHRLALKLGPRLEFCFAKTVVRLAQRQLPLDTPVRS